MSKNPSLPLLILMAIIAVAGFAGYAYWDSVVGLILLFAGVILGGSILIFKKEINLQINKKSGKSLSEKEMQYLNGNFPLLQHIPATRRPLFFQKVHLFVLDKEIISQDPSERVFHPAVLLCGAYAAFLEMKDQNPSIPFPGVPVYVFYGHAFPSPQYPKQLHISEYYAEDGALLFSVPHLIKGNEEQDRYFNSLLYESAKVALNGLFDSVEFPSLNKLCNYGGFTIQKMEEYIGLERNQISVKAFALTQFFIDVNRFSAAFPRIGELFRKEFLQAGL